MAAPNPERELQRLRQDLTKGLPGCVVIAGPARYFRNEAMDSVLAAVPAEVDVCIIDGEQSSTGGELEHLRGGGLFTKRSVLAVRRGDDWLKARASELERLLGKLGASGSLLLEVGKVDRRTKLGKALGAQAFYEFRDLYAEPYDRSRSPLEAELVIWVAERARSQHVALKPEAAFLLVATVGKDPAELMAELRRLTERFRGQRTPLGADQIRDMLTCSFESTPFELAEALLARDRRRCLRSLQAMQERGVRGRDGGVIDAGGVFPFVVSWLYQALAQAHEGRILLDQGVALRDLPGRVGVHAFQERFLDQVVGNDLVWLQRALQGLVSAQRRLRLGDDPEWILERFVMSCLREAS